MSKRRFTQSRNAVAILASAGLLFSGVTSASADESPSNPVDAVADVSPVVGEVALADDQARALEGNVLIVDSATGAVSVTLPVSSNADSALIEGVPVLSDGESSDIVPVTLEDGSVAIHSVMNDASAPTSYRYTFNMDAGTIVDGRVRRYYSITSAGSTELKTQARLMAVRSEAALRALSGRKSLA
ncbi:hypothetical protein [Microbacterium sp. NPDC077057]|uniref:hypothetical protein n=1 Tax=unclassified Microbacterium TaxID=2609290 RepID=UPI00344A01A8